MLSSQSTLMGNSHGTLIGTLTVHGCGERTETLNSKTVHRKTAEQNGLRDMFHFDITLRDESYL